jgi:hypothetical protein
MVAMPSPHDSLHFAAQTGGPPQPSMTGPLAQFNWRLHMLLRAKSGPWHFIRVHECAAATKDDL